MKTAVKTLLALVVLGVVGLAPSIASAQTPPIIAPKTRNFDHTAHDAALKAKGKTAPECATCHRVDESTGAVKGRNHDRCDNSGCHNLDHDKQSASFVTIEVAAQCAVCHTATRPRPGIHMQGTDKAFVARFAHNRHMGLGDTIKTSCGHCHENEIIGSGMEAPKGEAHAACSGCHNKSNKKVTMGQCSGCHVGKGSGTVASKDEYTLIPFDHAKHHDRSKTTADCFGCHKGVGDPNIDDSKLPKPSMDSCYTQCHNGKTAFSAVGTKCTQCHVANGNQGPAPQTRSDQVFSHLKHKTDHHAAMDDCASCHSVEKNGKLLAPGIGKDHQPCANSGCHDKEFESRQTKICAACHDSAAPWAKAVPRLQANAKTEFFGAINHQSHLRLGGTDNASCQGCHGNKLADAPGPKEHEGCATGGKCHGGPSAPSMNDCKLCHKSEKAERAPVSEWTVAANFKHSIHGTDPRSHNQTACIGCHNTIPNATDMKSLALPAMKQCDSCHDGKTAFKTTGFECAKCHTKAAPVAPANAMALPSGRPVQLSMLQVREAAR